MTAFPPAKRYALLCEVVERGVGFGVSRWLKYRDDQMDDVDRDALEEQLVQEVLNEICDRFEFD